MFKTWELVAIAIMFLGGVALTGISLEAYLAKQALHNQETVGFNRNFK